MKKPSFRIMAAEEFQNLVAKNMALAIGQRIDMGVALNLEGRILMEKAHKTIQKEMEA